MRLIILKITEPHGWVIANTICEKYPSFIKVNYSDEIFINSLAVPQTTSLEELSQAIKYWFTTRFRENKHLLILTNKTEEENVKLIEVLDNINLDNYCILICNDFMKKYFNNS